ncbi:hypothetical protein PPL_01581 [Heterostelium album PN500]|uniref:F-box domain-containing protein n=1 Tax=Heterostelium pallidum (strain ATCC 26659 / Pp 5 / PN500) TaxID=670386 RepID=D3AZW7_HETP5|nr:hypothetical protein PPL_01581 [Heterostelium album PN500]EFA84591.1 hypothetical protein PPL_01581 [Heterostelium album PN500]|eukprot:XP_020436704.1 hypothetical protein PPL_01581 [Heterostelium album PN500]
MDQLPNEILSTIFKQLSSRDLLSIQHSSHQMESIVDSCNHWDSIYQKFCPRVFNSALPQHKQHLKFLVIRFHPWGYQNEFLWLVKSLDSFKDSNIRFTIIHVMHEYLNQLNQQAKQDIISYLQPSEFIEQLIRISNDYKNFNHFSNHTFYYNSLNYILEIIMKLMEIYNESIKVYKFLNWIMSHLNDDNISDGLKEVILNIVYASIKMSPELIGSIYFNERMKELMAQNNTIFHNRVLEIIDRIISLKFDKYIQSDLIASIIPKVYDQSLDLRVDTLKTIEKLSRNLNLVSMLFKLGTIEILTQLLNETSNLSLIRIVIGIIINMTNDKATIGSLVENGIIPLLLQLLKYYPTDLMIQYNTIKVYSILTVSSNLQEAIIASGALKYIQSASRRFPEHQDSINELFLFLNRKKNSLNL